MEDITPIDSFSENWKNFLDQLEIFVEKKIKSGWVQDLYHDGLNIFLKLPNAELSALFLLREADFDFDLKLCLPEESEGLANALFAKHIDSGNIGSALSSGKVVTVASDNPTFDKRVDLIIPLRIATGFIGIVIVKLVTNISELDQIILRLCSLHASLFAGTIQNAQILRDIARTKAILEQKIAARTMDLTQSQRELQAILDSMLTAILVVDSETGLIVRSNPMASKVIGEPEKFIINNHIDTFLPPISFVSFNETEEYNNKNYESILQLTNGSVIQILRNAIQINLGNKKLRIESFTDITPIKVAEKTLKETNKILELKVEERTVDLQLLIHKLKSEIAEREFAEQELKKSFEKEKELSDMKTRFVTMVSHEFRTPLTIIKSSAQMIEKYDDRINPDDKKFLVERIVKTVDVMTDLIENVIFIGKSDSGALQQTNIEFNMIEFCTSLIDDIKLAQQESRIIEFNHSGDCPSLLIDKKLLRLVLSNLISNALKYSSGEKPVEISLDCYTDQVKVAIRDYGIGIPDDEQSKITELFYRARNVNSIPGTGLGMAVVIQSLQEMNAKLGFTSKVNEGTTFIVTIPVNNNG